MLGQPLDMTAAGRARHQAGRRAAPRRDRHRPRAHAHRAAARAAAWWARSSSSTAPASAALTLADRATISNMSPEFGATSAIFPVDDETLRYLRDTGRPRRAGRAGRALHQGAGPVPHRRRARPGVLRHARPSTWLGRAEPRRPAPAAGPGVAARSVARQLRGRVRREPENGATARQRLGRDRGDHLVHQHLEPGADGRRRAARPKRGRARARAPAVGQDQPRARARGWSWTTSSAPAWSSRSSRSGSTWSASAAPPASATPARCPTTSPPRSTATGSRWPRCSRATATSRRASTRRCKANYLASPPLVVAYALAGTRRQRPQHRAARRGLRRAGLSRATSGRAPTRSSGCCSSRSTPPCTTASTARSSRATSAGAACRCPRASCSPGIPTRPTCARRPSSSTTPTSSDIVDARVLALPRRLGHDRPHLPGRARSRRARPAGSYLIEHGVEPREFNSYGARRGNHEVMVRGTFANIRLRNKLLDGVEGGYTAHLPDGEQMTIFDAANRYREEGVPLVVIAGREYGSGSSRDWAAKGSFLMGVRAVIAETFERIHRSNLVALGVLPVQLLPGESRREPRARRAARRSRSAGSTTLETGSHVTVELNGGERSFEALARLDSPADVKVYRDGRPAPDGHGPAVGILRHDAGRGAAGGASPRRGADRAGRAAHLRVRRADGLAGDPAGRGAAAHHRRGRGGGARCAVARRAVRRPRRGHRASRAARCRSPRAS